MPHSATPESQRLKPISVSIIMPVMDETTSLRETVDIVMNDIRREDIHEVICVVSKFTKPESLAMCKELEESYPGIVWTRQQTKPYLGGALQDAFAWSTGTHIMLMASDLETEPRAAKDMIAKARSEGWDIVATTRWTEGGGFAGYNPVKLVANWFFQKGIGFLYHTNLTDLTFGYRIWRTETLRGHQWEELRHPFLLECLLRPLLNGATSIEIPVKWEARKEGESHNPFWRNFVYFRIALKLRFQGRNRIAARPAAEANQ
ncbi:MAG TPA: glycosyltransferase family 2 protein [Bryobacteraceae bacterium]|jgi:glycosyltransferase involved in cell wall biosynthesis